MSVGLSYRGILLVADGPLVNQQDHVFLNSFSSHLSPVEEGKDIEHEIPK